MRWQHFSDSSLGVPSLWLQEEVNLGREGGGGTFLFDGGVTFALSEIPSPPE